MAYILTFIASVFIGLFLFFRASKKHGVVVGKIRNLRVARPLYKDPKRKGTRFDFQVWIENNTQHAVVLGVPTIEINLKSGKVHQWKMTEEAVGTIEAGSYVIFPKRRDQYLRLYLDDVPQHELDLYSLSASVRDDKGILRVFIQE
jgi:hypothetical protein